jgi:hypothetical protein
MRAKYAFTEEEKVNIFKIRRAGTVADVVAAYPNKEMFQIKRLLLRMGLSSTDNPRNYQ